MAQKTLRHFICVSEGLVSNRSEIVNRKHFYRQLDFHILAGAANEILVLQIIKRFSKNDVWKRSI